MRTYAALVVLLLVSLACSSGAPRRLDLYPTPTIIPTQTERLVVWTQTPNATFTAVVVVVSATPNAPVMLCVSASESVYLRPSPNADNYPLATLPNGTHLQDLGGRSGNWRFVATPAMRGWVNDGFLEVCE